MNKTKLFFRSLAYSIRLVRHAGGAMILLYVAVKLLTPTVALLTTFSLKYVLDALTVPAPQPRTVLLWAAVYALTLLLDQIAHAVGNLLYQHLFGKAEHLYDCEVAEKMAELPLSVIDSSAGKNMIDDVRYTKNTAVYTVSRVVLAVTYAYSFVVAFVVLVRFHPLFSLLFLALALPGVFLHMVFERRADDLRRRTAPDVRKFSYYRWMLTDAAPAKDIRMYDLTEPITARYHEEKEAYLVANKRLDKRKTVSKLLADLLFHGGKLSFIVFVVLAAIRGEITVGDVALYTGLALTVTTSFNNFLYSTVLLVTRNTERMARMFEFFAIETEQKSGGRVLERFESLRFDRVYFKYPHTEHYVLEGVTFTLCRGDKLSIVGVNGSGKSTVIKLMLGLYEIESGQILLNGHPLGEYDIQSVRCHFSALFQSFAQYPLTLRENVALSALGRVGHDGEIEAALRQSGLWEDLAPKLANGLDSHMTRKFDDRGTELSKGQWQKLALSRAYFKQAAVIIFDEPSAALDAEAEDRIFRSFEDMSAGKTGIMISHRISGSRLANKIIVLDGGRITEQGTHDELLRTGGLYAKLYRLQQEKYAAGEGM